MQVEPSRDAGPVPGGNPIARSHEPPDLLQHLGDTVGVAQSSVGPDGSDGSAHPLLLHGVEAGGPDQEAGEEQQHLARVRRLEGSQERQRLVDGQCDARVEIRRLPRRRRGLGSVTRGRGFPSFR